MGGGGVAASYVPRGHRGGSRRSASPRPRRARTEAGQDTATAAMIFLPEVTAGSGGAAGVDGGRWCGQAGTTTVEKYHGGILDRSGCR